MVVVVCDGGGAWWLWCVVVVWCVWIDNDDDGLASLSTFIEKDVIEVGLGVI